MPRPKKVRKLISLYSEKERGTMYVDFAYYINGEWTGESESAHITPEQFYKALRRFLEKQTVDINRR
jgi:serine protease inhibitor